jgi:hypothetical protein
VIIATLLTTSNAAPVPGFLKQSNADMQDDLSLKTKLRELNLYSHLFILFKATCPICFENCPK